MQTSELLRGIIGIYILMAGAGAMAYGAVQQFEGMLPLVLSAAGLALVPTGSLTVARGLGVSIA